MILKNKRIVLGITGGIAAYKMPELVRLLIKQGAEVKVVLTESAAQFVAAETLHILSGHPVYQSLEGLAHIDLARWADLIVIAPATANSMAKIAHGFADDLLSTICLATQSSIMFVPAMNTQMWLNPSTQANKVLLEKQINKIILNPDSGIQACGENGPGRLLSPDNVMAEIIKFFENENTKKNKKLVQKNILITAGSTRELIDPVRYISNLSSGKMGYALAQAAHEAGAQVTLVSGPVNIKLDRQSGINIIPILTAQDLYHAVLENIAHHDFFISAAAVSDYRPEKIMPQKIKKTDSDNNDTKLVLSLVKNPDILKAVSELRIAHKIPKHIKLIGFAAETENVIENAKQKLVSKKIDMIIANDVSDNKVFDQDYNEVTVITPSQNYPLKRESKANIARKIIDCIAGMNP